MVQRSRAKAIARRERRQPLPPAVPKAGKARRGRTAASETSITIRAAGIAGNDAIRDFARQQAGRKLAKFALYIERITLHLADVSGPSGAPSISCRVVIAVSRLGPTVAQAVDETAAAAVTRALADAERALRRTIERVEARRTRRRSS